LNYKIFHSKSIEHNTFYYMNLDKVYFSLLLFLSITVIDNTANSKWRIFFIFIFRRRTCVNIPIKYFLRPSRVVSVGREIIAVPVPPPAGGTCVIFTPYKRTTTACVCVYTIYIYYIIRKLYRTFVRVFVSCCYRIYHTATRPTSP